MSNHDEFRRWTQIAAMSSDASVRRGAEYALALFADHDALAARMAEALRVLDTIDEEGDDHYYGIADSARMILRGIVTMSDSSEATVNRTADSADDGTKHHPNCTPPCGICEPDEWEKQFLASGVDPVDGI